VPDRCRGGLQQWCGAGFLQRRGHQPTPTRLIPRGFHLGGDILGGQYVFQCAVFQRGWQHIGGVIQPLRAQHLGRRILHGRIIIQRAGLQCGHVQYIGGDQCGAPAQLPCIIRHQHQPVGGWLFLIRGKLFVGGGKLFHLGGGKLFFLRRSGVFLEHAHQPGGAQHCGL